MNWKRRVIQQQKGEFPKITLPGSSKDLMFTSRAKTWVIYEGKIWLVVQVNSKISLPALPVMCYLDVFF